MSREWKEEAQAPGSWQLCQEVSVAKHEVGHRTEVKIRPKKELVAALGKAWQGELIVPATLTE